MANLIEVWSNGGETTIADVGGITAGATAIAVPSGEGARLPAIGTDEVARLVLRQTNLPGAAYEVVWMTARATDALTVARNKEGTNQAWPQGTKVIAAPTNRSLIQLPGLKLLDIVDPSGAAAATLTKRIDDSFDEYRLRLDRVRPSDDNQGLWLRLSSDGGSSYDAGAGNYSWRSDFTLDSGTAAPTAANNGSDTKIVLAPELGNTSSNEYLNGWVTLHNLRGGFGLQMITWDLVYFSQVPNFRRLWGHGKRNAPGTNFNALQLLLSGAGNFASGTISLYGVKKATFV